MGRVGTHSLPLPARGQGPGGPQTPGRLPGHLPANADRGQTGPVLLHVLGHSGQEDRLAAPRPGDVGGGRQAGRRRLPAWLLPGGLRRGWHVTFQRCRKSGQSAGVGGAGVLGGVFPGDPPPRGRAQRRRPPNAPRSRLWSQAGQRPGRAGCDGGRGRHGGRGVTCFQEGHCHVPLCGRE